VSRIELSKQAYWLVCKIAKTYRTRRSRQVGGKSSRECVSIIDVRETVPGRRLLDLGREHRGARRLELDLELVAS
jgi:hypothetical protein